MIEPLGQRAIANVRNIAARVHTSPQSRELNVLGLIAGLRIA